MSVRLGHMLVIDDGDPRIQYDGDWFVWRDVGEIGRWGPPKMNTLHGIQRQGSLSFQFYGRQVQVYGYWTPPPKQEFNTSFQVLPAEAIIGWQCLIDGVLEIYGTADRRLLPDDSSIRYLFCDQGGLSENRIHTIQTIFNSSLPGLAWFDTIQYRALPTADIRNEWSTVSYNDERVNFSSGWEQAADQSYTWTFQTDASLTYDFTGDGLTWGGYIQGGNSTTGPGLGSYTIDGKQPPTYFAIPIHTESRVNQAYINITGLEPGQHRLKVVNRGNAATAPLGLSYIYTKNSADRKTKGGKVVGAAVGASLGAVVIIGILAFIFIGGRRKRNKDKNRDFGMDGGSRTNGTVAGNEMEHRPQEISPTVNPMPGQTPMTVIQDGRLD